MSDEAPHPFRLHTLLSMACDGVGPSQTCLNLARAMQKAGADIPVFATRRRVPANGLHLRTILAGPFAWLPYRYCHGTAAELLERWYVQSMREGDIAYLWPAASVAIHRHVHARGVPILLESINTRMRFAKHILDEAYDTFGAHPGHGITERRIDEEEEKLSLAAGIFAPSRTVEASLREAPSPRHVIAASYGIHVPARMPEPATSGRGKTVVFTFCGYASIRKGTHLLLSIWQDMPPQAVLRLVGNMEPVLRERYADLLSSGRIEVHGFTRDVEPLYRNSDVFLLPSLEEGDPLVIYEAALHGLPIITSPMGGSHLGDAVITLPVAEREAWKAYILEFMRNPDRRRHYGLTAQTRVQAFDWSAVGAARLAALHGIYA